MTSSAKKPWQEYEHVARCLLDRFREHFGLDRVEGKQRVTGVASTWELDAKGVLVDGAGIVVVECRRRKTRVPQEDMGGIAYKIRDVGAGGGLVVTPLPLQKGAASVAAQERIQHVTLTESSTTTDYFMKFLYRIFVGVSSTVVAHDEVKITVIRSE